MDASLVILGGGRGTRMGGNKLFLSVGGRFLWEVMLQRMAPWFREVIMSVGPRDVGPLSGLLPPAAPGGVPIRVAVDRSEALGPLEGLRSALAEARSGWAFAVGCDMPLVQHAVVRKMWSLMESRSMVICARLGGFLEPLHAFYSTGCLPAVDDAISRGERRLKGFYHRVEVTVVEEEALRYLPYRRSFLGVNTPKDLADRLDQLGAAPPWVIE